MKSALPVFSLSPCLASLSDQDLLRSAPFGSVRFRTLACSAPAVSEAWRLDSWCLVDLAKGETQVSTLQYPPLLKTWQSNISHLLHWLSMIFPSKSPFIVIYRKFPCQPYFRMPKGKWLTAEFDVHPILVSRFDVNSARLAHWSGPSTQRLPHPPWFASPEDEELKNGKPTKMEIEV